ncbi:peptidoglycan DD-metalloendopeptidase family protein [Mycobacterium sp. SMC-11]|uniref:peptidoglycan DD-metalloendopeptidase family protein n=1 Tax=Mycobacterium sp. SMC-11 TaxID=3385969 RepID=UPI00390C97C6
MSSAVVRFWPLESGRIITSPFGIRSGEFHTGCDFGFPGGSGGRPVYAVQAGTVIFAGAARGYGGPDPAGWLVVDSSAEQGGGCLEYGHIVREVAVGETVAAGQRIGRVNPSSASNGGVAPHLHLADMPHAYNPAAKQDPLPRLAGAREPTQPQGDDVTLFYPDVSNNNWRTTTDAVNFLSRLAGEGFSAVCHKVTEGSSYRDPFWPAVRDWCTANGMLLIGYHYVRTGDPAVQARLYRDHVGDPRIPCMLDFEDGSGDIAQFWAVVKAFNKVDVEVALSYIPRWYWRDHIGSPSLVGVPGLVSSAYPGGTGYASNIYEFGGGSQGSGWSSYGGAAPVVWQFTDKATVAGIPVDVNAFRGSLDDFKHLLGIARGGMMAAPSNDDKLNYIYGQLQPYPQLTGKPDALAALRTKIANDVDLTLVDAVAAHIHGLFPNRAGN